MKAYGVIYKHTNKINGKSYIGQSIQIDNIERRWRRQDPTHKSYQSCKAFFRALNKYGWNNFETELLFTAFDQESLNFFEEHFINHFKALAPSGYNSSMMVDGSQKFTDATKKKMSDKRKEYFANLPERPVAVNRKLHSIINEVPHKNCSDCKTDKELSSFNGNTRTWDKLMGICRDCMHIRDAAFRAKKIKLTPEEVKQSYINRREKMREGVLNSYKENPELRQQKSKQLSKAIIGTNISTGEIIEFESALLAKESGYDNTNIGIAIRKRTIYKNHLWKFKAP